MSINRGLYQGKNMMNKLAFTHQTEMASRLLLTITAAIPIVPPSIIVAIGIMVSFIFGQFLQKKIITSVKNLKEFRVPYDLIDKKGIVTFSC
jgi:hypothetical protein